MNVVPAVQPSGADLMAALSLNGVSIHRDAEGRYSLNDFHAAAGGDEADAPSKFLRLKKTKELVAEFEEQTGHICPVSTIEGRNGGTYGVENLVIAYAAWISAKFYAHVLETFKQAAIAKVNAERVAPQPAIEDKSLATVSKGIMLLDLLAGSKNYGLTQDEHRNGIHKLCRLNGFPTDMLPPVTDDTYSCEGTATHLLRWGGRCLPAARLFKLLEARKIIYRHERPSTKDGGSFRSSWRFTTDGSRYGYDQPINEGRDYRPLFYPARFIELLRLIAPDVERLIASGAYKPKWLKDDNRKQAEAYRARMRSGQPLDVREAAADYR